MSFYLFDFLWVSTRVRLEGSADLFNKANITQAECTTLRESWSGSLESAEIKALQGADVIVIDIQLS